MKKLFLAVFAVFAFASVNAQNFGVFANFASNSFDGEDSASGFNIGLFAGFEISETLSIQPEVAYTSSSVDDASYNLININGLLKYNVSEKFSLLAGPQLGFASGDIPDALDAAFGDDFSSLNFQLAIGAAFDITEDLFIQARYGFQVNEHVDGIGSVNTLNAGLGYRF